MPALCAQIIGRTLFWLVAPVLVMFLVFVCCMRCSKPSLYRSMLCIEDVRFCFCLNSVYVWFGACKVLMVLHIAVSLHSPLELKAPKRNGNCPIRALALWAAEHYAPPHAHRVR